MVNSAAAASALVAAVQPDRETGHFAAHQSTVLATTSWWVCGWLTPTTGCATV